MEDFNSLEANVKTALVSTIRSANAIGNEDIAFHRSLDPATGNTLDQQNARLLGLAERLVGAATANTEIVRPPRLKDLDGVEANWRAVVDVVDSLLERADTALDEFTGAVKRLSPGVDQTTTPQPARGSKIAAALKNKNIQKPQVMFEHVPKNDEAAPFKPLLLSKPHASAPLDTHPIASDPDTQSAYATHLFMFSQLGALEHERQLEYLFPKFNSRLQYLYPRPSIEKRMYPNMNPNLPSRYPHPYQLEIEQYRYPSSLYTQSEPIKYHPFESTTATFVDTEEAVYEMLEELKQAKEIAVDLEHHDSRSYIGIVCLMQISTRDKDWIVDTLKPWRRKLQCLNEVFANPNIVKVLHGAHMDVIWLQRDLGLYLVGLFDTHHASRALGYAGGSLAFLLKKFIDLEAQKQFQMADWRVRPLPQELFDYARSDTHFLLYIFDNMRNELIQRSDFSKPDHEGDKLWDVLQKSAEYALQRYEHPVYDAEFGQGSQGWYKLISRTPALLNKEQFSVFRAVHKWRDDIARQQDDSISYVMPNYQIFNVAKNMPLTRAQLLSDTQPASQTLRLRADELLSVVRKAKDAGKDGPEMISVLGKADQLAGRGSPGRSVAATAKALEARSAPAAPTTQKAPTTSANGTPLPIRSSTSSFWGRAFESSAWNQKRAASSNAVGLAIPLPPLTAEIFADPAESSFVKTPSPEPEPTPAKIEQPEDDVFVLKDLGKKRKRVETDDGMAANSDEVALFDNDPRAQEKAERKAAKKAAKRAAKAAVKEEQDDEAGEEEAPFDYASAPSILNPPRSKESMKERKKKEKQLNPYAKALDTAKGLPRTQKEKAGKSMTYKS